MNILDEAPSIVAAAKAHGWATVLPKLPITKQGELRKQKQHNFGVSFKTPQYHRLYQQTRRNEFNALGLTQRGTIPAKEIKMLLESKLLFILRLSRQ